MTQQDCIFTIMSRYAAQHSRLELFMGKEWSEQLIAALHKLSMSGPRSYEYLLAIAVDTVIKASLGEPPVLIKKYRN